MKTQGPQIPNRALAGKSMENLMGGWAAHQGRVEGPRGPRGGPASQIFHMQTSREYEPQIVFEPAVLLLRLAACGLIIVALRAVAYGAG